ncbi:hypothetical protein [Paenochrobactrum pullorum]|uniref:hypothetical protein n=1 Tax=Paenochrobactrum pullorum TaxID=1324351 RepID=UPI0035BBC03E
MSDEGKELRRIRNKLSALSGAQWFLAADDIGNFVEAKTAQGDVVEVARFHKGATPEEIEFFANAPYIAMFLLGLVDRAIASVKCGQSARANKPAQHDPRNYAAEASMKCGEPAFKLYIHEKHGLEKPLTDDRVAVKLRSLLGVSSRKALNSDPQAAERWRSLRAGYTAWRRASR